MIRKVDPDCHLQETMEEALKKTRQIRTKSKEVLPTVALAKLITKTEVHLEKRNQKEITTT